MLALLEALIGDADKDLYHLDTYTDKSKAFYYRMQGDYYGYLAEVATDEDEKQLTVENAKEAYEKAVFCSKRIKATDPFRLSLALNYSVFSYEIVHDHGTAIRAAKAAFDNAIAELDTIADDERKYKATTAIMQMLRDKLTLWTEN